MTMIIPQAEPNGKEDALEVAFDAIKQAEAYGTIPPDIRWRHQVAMANLWTLLAIATELRHLRSNAGVLANIADGTALISDSIDELTKARSARDHTK